VIGLLPVTGLPELRPGDDLAGLIADAVALEAGDVVVVSQKVVSKVEGALVAVPPDEDREAARRRLTYEHAVRVVVEAPWTVVVETRHGLVCANAGIDASNVEAGWLALLPVDPDASARRLRSQLEGRTGAAPIGVVVADTFGRPWRVGQTDVAIGVAGLPPIRDERGGTDRNGVRLTVTEVAVADEVAAAADLVRRKADGVPVVVVRGLDWAPRSDAAAVALVRPSATDLFARGRGSLAAELGGPLAAGAPVERAAAAARAAGPVRAVVDGLRIALTVATDAEGLVALGAAGVAVRVVLLDLGLDAEVVAAEPTRGRMVWSVREPAAGRPR
jgi:coenzyme F420-0:L-glutamate ligase/coenzyme F420-1:gamma-L-glutamate ligase